MASAIEAQKAKTYQAKERSAADVARKEAILAQYAQVSDGELYPFSFDSFVLHYNTVYTIL